MALLSQGTPRVCRCVCRVLSYLPQTPSAHEGFHPEKGIFFGHLGTVCTGTHSFACLFISSVACLATGGWVAGPPLGPPALAPASLSGLCPKPVWEAAPRMDDAMM